MSQFGPFSFLLMTREKRANDYSRVIPPNPWKIFAAFPFYHSPTLNRRLLLIDFTYRQNQTWQTPQMIRISGFKTPGSLLL